MSSPSGTQIPKNSSTVFPNMSAVVPNMDEDELDLLLKMLKYDPLERISAKKKKKLWNTLTLTIWTRIIFKADTMMTL